MLQLTERQAEGSMPSIASGRFFATCAYMTSGPVMVQVLEGEPPSRVTARSWAQTDPKKAAPGTSARISPSIEENVVHGSDSAENAHARDRVLLR